VEFHLYQKFGADASITFETPAALPDDLTRDDLTREDKTKEEQAK